MDRLPFFRSGSWLRGNMHTHSTASDGRLAPDVVCKTFRQIGYDFVVLTDHFLAHWGFPLTDMRPFCTAEFTAMAGAELHAPRTSLGDMYHILGIGLPPDFAPNHDGETAAQLARRAADAGAFVALAHPAWYDLSDDDVTAIDAAHAIEIHNTVCDVYWGKGDSSDYLDRALARGHSLLAVANDDSHYYDGTDHGMNWVCVRAESREPDAILAALHAGSFYSSQGPQILGMAIAGGELVVRTSPIRRAWISIPRATRAQTDRMAAITDPILRDMVTGPWARTGRVLHDGDATESRFSLSAYLPEEVLRLTVEDASGRRAYTNPFSVTA